MVLKGRLTEILVDINPRLYKKYVVLQKGVNVIYARLHQALFVFLICALLFYLKLAIDLKNNDFLHKSIQPVCVKQTGQQNK